MSDWEERLFQFIDRVGPVKFFGAAFIAYFALMAVFVATTDASPGFLVLCGIGGGIMGLLASRS